MNMLCGLARLSVRLAASFTACKPVRPSFMSTAPLRIEPLRLNNLADNPHARREKKRVGRGPGSGLGKFAGRGMKGHKARSGGGVPPRFEGGQTPIKKRLPKYGQRRSKFRLDELNLGQIAYYIQRGVLDPSRLIDIGYLYRQGVIKLSTKGLKVLGKGAENLQHPIKLEVTNASQTVVDVVQKLGGSVTLSYKTPLLLKADQKPEKYPLMLEEPVPPKWVVKRFERLRKARRVPVLYRKPKWVQTLEAQEKEVTPEKPVISIVAAHKRKQRVYRTIKFDL